MHHVTCATETGEQIDTNFTCMLGAQLNSLAMGRIATLITMRSMLHSSSAKPVGTMTLAKVWSYVPDLPGSDNAISGLDLICSAIVGLTEFDGQACALSKIFLCQK